MQMSSGDIFIFSFGIRVGKDSWKKREVGKSDIKLERLKLESLGWSWKFRAEVRKYKWIWKVTEEVGKFLINLETNNEVGKLLSKLENYNAENNLLLLD